MTAVKCAFCDGVIAFAPYTENVGGQMMSFHAKA